MLFKLEISLNDAVFQADPQMTLAYLLQEGVCHWIRELHIPRKDDGTPLDELPYDANGRNYVNLYGQGGDVMPPIGKAEFLREPPPFKKK